MTGEYSLPFPYSDGTPQDHADMLNDHANLGPDMSLLVHAALASARLIERQAAEIERLRGVAKQLRSSLVDQHELASHWLVGDCEPCANAADAGDGALACDKYKDWQNSYDDATALSIEAVTA